MPYINQPCVICGSLNNNNQIASKPAELVPEYNSLLARSHCAALKIKNLIINYANEALLLVSTAI